MMHSVLLPHFHCGGMNYPLLLSEHLLLIDFCKTFTYFHQTVLIYVSCGFVKFWYDFLAISDVDATIWLRECQFILCSCVPLDIHKYNIYTSANTKQHGSHKKRNLISKKIQFAYSILVTWGRTPMSADIMRAPDICTHLNISNRLTSTEFSTAFMAYILTAFSS